MDVRGEVEGKNGWGWGSDEEVERKDGRGECRGYCRCGVGREVGGDAGEDIVGKGHCEGDGGFAVGFVVGDTATGWNGRTCLSDQHGLAGQEVAFPVRLELFCGLPPPSSLCVVRKMCDGVIEQEDKMIECMNDEPARG